MITTQTSLDKPKATLLTWMATNRDPAFLKNIIYALQKKYKREVGTIYYLYATTQDPKHEIPQIIKEVKEEIKGPELKFTLVDVKDASNYNDIYDNLTKVLKPMLPTIGDVFVNVSAGTQAASATWMLLKTSDFFNGRATFFFTPNKPVINRLDYSTPPDNQIIYDVKTQYKNTYLSLLQKAQTANPAKAVFGHSPKSRARQIAFKKINQFATVHGLPLLLLGERGVGKSSIVNFVVKAIKNKDVVEDTCGSWESGIADSTIFGHKKGAFTGSIGDRKGLLSDANNKILFLDEIQDMPHTAQRKMLRTLQEPQHPYRRVGDDTESFTSAEFVFASNRTEEDLKEILSPDFYDRISYLTVKIPPLRECKEDIEDDWKEIWQKACGNKATEAPWTPALAKYFSKDENLMGNFRSLQIVAYQIIAWNAQDNPEKIHEILKELEAENKAAFLREKTAKNQKFEVGNFPEFQNCSWKDAEKKFKTELSKWAHEKYDTWEKAAKALGCTQETLMKTGR